MKIHLAEYNPSTEESTFGTISIHRTKAGAEKAIKDHRAKEQETFNTRYGSQKGEPFPIVFAEWEDWAVSETELLD